METSNVLRNIATDYFSPPQNDPNKILKIASRFTLVVPVIFAAMYVIGVIGSIAQHAWRSIMPTHNPTVAKTHEVSKQAMEQDYNDLKDDIISMITTCNNVLNYKVEDGADVLCDKKSFSEDELSFLRDSKLSDLQFENTRAFLLKRFDNAAEQLHQ